MKKCRNLIYLHTFFVLMSTLGFEYAVESARSLVIVCALAEKEISVEKATSLSRLEVEFQVSELKVLVARLNPHENYQLN